MNRKLCLFLAALMIMITLSAASLAVMAEEEIKTVTVSGAFRVTVRVPEECAYEEQWINQTTYLANLTPKDPQAPTAMFTIALSEIYDGRTLNDFTEEEVNELIAIFQEHYDEPEHWITETGMGTKLIMIRDKSDADPFVEIITVYKGYEVSVLIDPGVTGVKITDEQIQRAIDFLTDMQITNE